LVQDVPAISHYARLVPTENQLPEADTAEPTFELRRFAWATPDRLEVSGTFGGLRDATPDAPPVLVVQAGESVHRLQAVPDSLEGPPSEGRVWQAQFAWRHPPVAFEEAELQLGAGMVVELPAPGTKRRLARARLLDVRTDPRRIAKATPEPDVPHPAAASVGSQVEVLAAQEEVREIRAAMEQTQAELARAHEDLEAERTRRASDGERFHEGLASVRESAEKALAEELNATRRLEVSLREAHETIEAKDAALDTLRGELEAAQAARMQVEQDADTLRTQVAKLESDDGREIERLGEELERSRARVDAARSELETTYSSIDQARSDAERLLGRLTAARAK